MFSAKFWIFGLKKYHEKSTSLFEAPSRLILKMKKKEREREKKEKNVLTKK